MAFLEPALDDVNGSQAVFSLLLPFPGLRCGSYSRPEPGTSRVAQVPEKPRWPCGCHHRSTQARHTETILRRPASSTTTPSLKGYSVETTFRHSGFAQVVVSVAFSCGRAMFLSPRGELGLDPLSPSPPIERRTFLLQALVCYPCAAASPDQTEREAPEGRSPTSTTDPSFFLWLPVRWLWLVQGFVHETVSFHCHRSLPTFGVALLQCPSRPVHLGLILAALTGTLIAHLRSLFRQWRSGR